MKDFIVNSDGTAKRAQPDRKIIYVGAELQLILTSLKPGEEVGGETSVGHELLLRIETGKGRLSYEKLRYSVGAGDFIIVPAGLRYYLKNTGKKRLRIYTVQASLTAAALPEQKPTKRSELLATEMAGKDMANEGGPVKSV